MCVVSSCQPGTKVGSAPNLCQPCDVLTFSDKENAVTCTPCAPGTFAAEPGQRACRACPTVGEQWDAMIDWVQDQFKKDVQADPDSAPKLEMRYRAGKIGRKAFKALCKQPEAHKQAKWEKKLAKRAAKAASLAAAKTK